MKMKVFLLAAFAIVLFAFCGNNKTNENSTTETTEYGIAKVEVFYFHATRRCPTCNKIEEVAKDFVLAQYAGQDVKFYSINFEEKQNTEIANKFNVTWSSLYIASGERVEDITDIAFQVVNANPEQLTEKMKSIIDMFLHTEEE